jgi:hypothetical protein
MYIISLYIWGFHDGENLYCVLLGCNAVCSYIWILSSEPVVLDLSFYRSLFPLARAGIAVYSSRSKATIFLTIFPIMLTISHITHFDPENGSSMFLRHLHINLQKKTALQLVRQFHYHFLFTVSHANSCQYLKMKGFSLNLKLFFTSLVHYMFGPIRSSSGASKFHSVNTLFFFVSGVKRIELEADYTPPFSADVRNACS